MNRPVVLFTLLWTFGYILAYTAEFPWLSLYTSLFGGIAVIVLWMIRGPWSKAVCMLLVVFIAAGYYEDYDRRNQSAITADSTEAASFHVEGIIVNQVEVDGDKAAFIVQSDDYEGERIIVSVRLLSKQEQLEAMTWQRGDRMNLQGVLQLPGESRNFGGFDYRHYLRFQHIHWQLTVKGASSINNTPPESWAWGHVFRWNDQFRSMLGDGVDRLFPKEQAGFMKGMLIGLTDDIDPQQFQQFSQLGLTHIIAISGLNVAVFLACLLWIMRRLGFTRETYLITAMIMMPIYIAVTGASPSIIRAGLMAMIGLYAAYRHTLKDGLHTVLIVGCVMLLWEPYYLLDVSFQLSFLVTIGLILGVPYANRLMPIRSRSWRDALSITIVAQCISFPVSIYYFNQFSLLSLAANFALVPVFSMFTMPAGTAALLISFAFKPVGQALAWLVAKVNEWIFMLVSAVSKWHLFQTIWPTPGLVWIIGYYAAWSLLIWGLLNRKRGDTALQANEIPGPMLTGLSSKSKPAGPLGPKVRSTFKVSLFPAASLCLIILLLFAYQPARWSQEGQVNFMDVGQGDSIFIRSPLSRSVILVDGGGTVTFRKQGEEWKQRSDPYEVGRKLLVPLLKQRGIQHIDYLIVTHQDADHIGGLQAVLEQIPVKQLIFNGTAKPTSGAEELFQTALYYGVKLVKVYAGDVLQIDKDTRLRFLFPLPTKQGETGIRLEKEQNAESVVFLMEMQDTRWLFTGDMEQASEAAVLRMIHGSSTADASPGAAVIGQQQLLLPSGQIDVLKIAHHGSKTSTTAAWLDEWQPKYAVISVGQNNVYGHPHPTVMSRLEERNVHILRTDNQGEIQMTIRDGVIRMRARVAEAD
ncbi:DNA internalization-related competence protein ComEC/Rec2 [Paenibacillus sp. RC67]|uniref:DNA internalization-related competence protein ComEC/Rec2 n=1 Tax=Paenibacillus sp. RC67 TaxID=3039392 RepID=UPI0024AD70B1|nr:DNA internalization-related competence protein ComEC/Rec2 [Paenibacillus sp. RC67]